MSNPKSKKRPPNRVKIKVEIEGNIENQFLEIKVYKQSKLCKSDIFKIYCCLPYPFI